MNQIGIQNLNLSEQELFLLQNHYKSCPRHPDNWIVSLSTDPNASQFLQCAQCLSETPNQNTLHLMGLIKDNEKAIFKNWPIQGNQELYEKLKSITESNSTVEDLITKVQDYFFKIRKQIEQQLQQKESQMLSQAKKLWNFNETILLQYNQFAEKNELKKIILDQKDDFHKQNQLFGETITRVFHNQKRYEQALSDSIDHFETQKNMIDFETPNQIQENIIQLIDSIDMFVIKNFEDLRINKVHENIEFYKKKLNSIKPSEMKTSQLFVKLVSNKLNNCSEELLKELQIIIGRASSFLDKYDIKDKINEELLDINLDKLNKQQLNIIRSVTQSFVQDENAQKIIQTYNNKNILIELISNRFNHCSNDFISKLSTDFDKISSFLETLDFSDYLIQGQTPINGNKLTKSQLQELSQITKFVEEQNFIKNNQGGDQQKIEEIKQQVKQLNLIFENKSNYCSNEFIENAKQISSKYPEIIYDLYLRHNVYENDHKQPMNFNIFNIQQLNNINKLVDKISQLSEKYGQNYISNQYPQLEQQYNSTIILGQVNPQIRDNISKLLLDYPIFDTQEKILIQKIKLDFIKTNYQRSQDLVLEATQLGNPIVKQPKSLNGQIATKDPLNPDLNYIFRCKVNKNLDCNGIIFGVQKTDYIHQNYIQNENSCFYSNSNARGLNKVLKGKNLYEVRSEIDHLEIRVNIKKRIVVFLDYPNYRNIVQMNEDNMTLNTNYSFGIEIYTPGDDYNIEITDILLVDDESILKFD